MTLKSDKWIKRNCEEYVVVWNNGLIEGSDKASAFLHIIDTVFNWLAFAPNNKEHTLSIDGSNPVIVQRYLTTHRIVELCAICDTFKVEFNHPIFDDAKCYIEKVKNDSIMIEPFVPESIKVDERGQKIPSYGLSSFGYDIRLGRNIKLFKQAPNHSHPYADDVKVEFVKNNCYHTSYIDTSDVIIDACDFSKHCYEEYNNVDEIVIPPRGFVLAHTVEKFNMPSNVMGVCIGKSTHARTGIHILVTPLEPGWSGYLTLEISNLTGLPIRLKTGTGIAQINFYESDEQCETTYLDRGGKYQNQAMIPVDPKV
jgi:dCTP deaminase